MRLIIQPDYQSVSQWAAHYVAAKIKVANPTPEKPFVLGCPTGSSPLGMYKALIDLNKKEVVQFWIDFDCHILVSVLADVLPDSSQIHIGIYLNVFFSV